MISIYAFSLFLWICLALQAPAQGLLTKVKKVSRIDLGDSLELSIEFEADGPVQAVWWQYDREDDPLPGSLENGKATLKITKEATAQGGIYLRLGTVPTHFGIFRWNVKGDGDKTLDGGFPWATVTPGVDLVHDPSETLEVEIAAADVSSFRKSNMLLVGEYWNTTLNEVIRHEVPPVVQKSKDTQNGVMTTTLKFSSDDVQPITGYFVCLWKSYATDEDNSPLYFVMEYITLTVHGEDQQVPFPLTYVDGVVL